ncbi:DNA methyltransferase [Rhodobacter capsulatus]|uniref:DNA methyltransferase n=1 Tax=Rhodobacter capsulatus TaxID=1061 RepID=UPI0003FFB6B5|nr:DNA methyltransferase [Rhodobacter capsulatus]
MKNPQRNAFFFGDNLHVLREYVADESVDLIYLDPPFNSNATYNLLFKSPDKARWSDAQIATFDDTWRWGDVAEDQFSELSKRPGKLADLMLALRSVLGENDMMAYLSMMAARMVELRRVLKRTGSLYLHCDPTASHYLKILLDGVFGAEWYRAEIIWKRTNARGTPKNWPHLHDAIFHYSSEKSVHQIPKVKADNAKMPHTLITGADGLKYQTYELTGAGVTREGETGKPWRGFDVSALGRHWGNSHAQLDAWADAGLIHFPPNNGFPRRRGAEPFDPSSREVTVGDVWTDIDRLNQTARERLGYPTQKPIALLERILSASSRPGDVVLDPFCGCGTTLHAAEMLGRHWLGIDVAVQAMTVVRDRIKNAFPMAQFDVFGLPNSVDGAVWLAANDPFKFEEWAVSRIGAMHSGRYRNDHGIDGYFYFLRGKDAHSRGIVSVKGGQHVHPGMIRDLVGTLHRERSQTRDSYAIAVFVCAREPTKGMLDEARKAGTIQTDFGEYPSLQILSVADIFSGGSIRVPLLYDSISAAAAGRKKAPSSGFVDPREMARQRQMLFTFTGTNTQSAEPQVLPDRSRNVA